MHIPEETEVFVLAWECWRKGFEPQAARLYEAAKRSPLRPYQTAKKLKGWQAVKVFASDAYDKLRDKLTPGKGVEREKSFQGFLENSLSSAAVSSAEMDCGNPAVSRAKLVEEFEIAARRYPKNEHTDRARKMAAALKRMLEEDKAHDSTGVREIAQLPIDERVRELIYRLRDQNSRIYWRYAGDRDRITADTNSPAHQLVLVGYAAVPQLIDALKSDDLSRSLGSGRFISSPYVLTVGDCASEILAEIFHREFRVSGNAVRAASNLRNGTSSSELREAAQKWWAEFQAKGERQMLIDGVAAGDDDSAAQAEMLIKEYPDDAVDAIRRGMEAPATIWIRNSLIRHLGTMTNTVSLNALRDELRIGPSIRSRAAAATALQKRDFKQEALAGMMREWEHPAPANEEDSEALDDVVRFLAECDSVEAIKALQKTFTNQPVSLRMQIVDAVGDSGKLNPKNSSDAFSPDTSAAAEECLIAALTDTEQRTAMSVSRGNKSCEDPRVCDMAAWLLSENWPERYSFDIEASFKSRNEACLECMNVWRRAHGLPAMPVPETNTTKLSRQEANVITRIAWDIRSMKPGKSFEDRIANFKHKQLRAENILGLISDFMRQPEPGAGELVFTVFKDGDLTGAQLNINLVPGTSTASNEWSINWHVVLGEKPSRKRSSSSTFGIRTDSKDWLELREEIEKALAAPAESPYEIGVELIE